MLKNKNKSVAQMAVLLAVLLGGLAHLWLFMLAPPA